MKKLFLMLVMCLFASAAFAQSLGDVARANRAKKHSNASETKLDDDSMPHSISLSSSEPDAAKKDDKKTDDKDADAKDKDADTKSADAKDGDAKDAKKDAVDAKKQKSDDLQKQIAEETKEISTLQRELDIAQREARLRAAAFYGDAGTMLRDQAKYADETRKSQAEIDGKKQALDAAQQKLADLQEQARKAGLPQQ
jgi:chromosome segregation ATPase